jgi:hypothetical protein
MSPVDIHERHDDAAAQVLVAGVAENPEAA